ncbi:Ctr copper transporter family-domain-containing protein [Ganoderma leucocontextum]|nr:Ctr copper transporter family-domain-containing protein [Ganoderma leucocontextum]
MRRLPRWANRHVEHVVCQRRRKARISHYFYCICTTVSPISPSCTDVCPCLASAGNFRNLPSLPPTAPSAACGPHRSHHSLLRLGPPSTTLLSAMDMSSSNSSVIAMMVPWLHFTGGDNLLFEAWHPSSNGAIAGACIGLVFFAIFERWVNGMRGVLEGRWRQQALATMTSSTADNACHAPGSPSHPASRSPKLKEVGTSGVEEVNINPLPSQSARRLQRPIRTIPPFIPSHDIPRGALFAFQALLYYVLMLAVMTFQAGYLISIVAGLTIGEVLFGRFGAKGHPGH